MEKVDGTPTSPGLRSNASGAIGGSDEAAPDVGGLGTNQALDTAVLSGGRRDRA
jgi:hypothetical protein